MELLKIKLKAWLMKHYDSISILVIILMSVAVGIAIEGSMR